MNKLIQSIAVNGSTPANTTTPLVSTVIVTDWITLASLQLAVATGVIGTWLVEVTNGYNTGNNGMPTTTPIWTDISVGGNPIPQPTGAANQQVAFPLGNPFFCWSAMRVTFTPAGNTGAGTIQAFLFAGAI